MSTHRQRDDAAAIGTGSGLIAAGGALEHRLKGANPKLARSAAASLGTRGLSAAGIPLVAYGVLGRAQRKTPVKVAHDVVDATVDLPGGRRKRGVSRRDVAVASGAGVAGRTVTGAAMRHAAPRGKLIGTTLGTVIPTASVAAGSRLRRRQEHWDSVANRSVSKIWYPGKPSMSAKEKKDAVDNFQLKRRTNRANYGATVAGAGSLTLRAGTTLLPKKLKAGKVVNRVNRGAEYVAGASGAVYTGTGLAQMKSTRYEERVEAARLKAAGAKVPDKVIGHEPVKKDRFLRENAQHISPAAESGYGHLKGMRRHQQAQGVAGLALTDYAGAAALKSKGRLVPVHAAAAVLGGGTAMHSVRRSRELQGRMDKIKAKAYERKAVGELGRGRDPQELAKALWTGLPKPPGQMSARLPKGLRRKPSLRRASVRRTGYGLQQTTVASSYG